MVKVGDKYRYVGEKSEYYTPNKVYAIREIIDRDDGADECSLVVEDDRGPEHKHWWSQGTMKGRFESLMSPIVTRTVKELKPGTYGKVHVAWNHIAGKATVGVCHGDAWVIPLSAQELREAANTFIEIADYLDEQK